LVVSCSLLSSLSQLHRVGRRPDLRLSPPLVERTGLLLGEVVRDLICRASAESLRGGDDRTRGSPWYLPGAVAGKPCVSRYSDRGRHQRSATLTEHATRCS